MSDYGQKIFVLAQDVNTLKKENQELRRQLARITERLDEMHKKCMTVTEYQNADFWGIDEE